VERSATDPNKIEATYEGDHTHAAPPPPARGVLSGNKIAPADPSHTAAANKHRHDAAGAATAAVARPPAARRKSASGGKETAQQADTEEEEEYSDSLTPDKRRNVRAPPRQRV
jgi:hypothetical protein